ncbi:MAG: hypothetical protein LPK21_01890, partial [Hymenobacteraceae bacterium]|nr:hypothetical protein [Hymenobacteraceae bacterium]
MMRRYTRNFSFLFKGLVLFAIAFITIVQQNKSYAQTKGLIVQPATGAGASVLDPDGDGYVSVKTDGIQRGFTTSDEAQSEIPYKPIPLPQLEPLRDLIRGPKGGFTDFSYVGTNLNPVYTYTTSGASPNLMFRFRLGSVAPNSKGYSILIDTDQKFGVGEDVNATAANPGFEVEIVLATNHGVYLYNVDGKSTVNNSLATDLVATMPVAQYSHKALALTEQGGDPDYFYDFFIPFSEITSKIPSFQPTTKVRMIANTVMAPHSALNGPISDIGGVDDAAYGENQTGAWSYIVTGQIPARIDTTTSFSLPPVRTAAPVVNSPLLAGATAVSGTSTEAVGTIIEVFAGTTSLGTTTVVTGNTWSLTGLSPLTQNQAITAKATATDKSVSLVSNTVYVQAAQPSCTTSPNAPAITTQSNNNKGVTGTGTDGFIVRVYVNGVLQSNHLGAQYVT